MITQYKVTVIGAGPSGLLAVSELVARQIYPIAWVDPNFSCGMINVYQHVNSNNQVYFEKELISKNTWIKKNQRQNEFIEPLKDLPDELFTKLQSQMNTLLKLQELIIEDAKANLQRFSSKAVSYTEVADGWNIQLENGQQLLTDNIFFCVGGVPLDVAKIQPQFRDILQSAKQIPFIDAVCPDRAQGQNLKNQTVAVFGRSHSGILAVKELFELPEEQRPQIIYLVYKGVLKWYTKLPDGKYLHQFSGVKGETKKWYQSIMEPKPPQGIILIEDQQFLNQVQYVDSYVSCIGFKRNSLGYVQLKDGQHLQDEDIGYDFQDNYLYHGFRNRLNGFYGFGLAFPEKTVDISGAADNINAIEGFQDAVQKVLNKRFTRD